MTKPKQAETGELTRLRQENEDLRSRLERIATLAAGEDLDDEDDDEDDDDEDADEEEEEEEE